MKKKFLVSLLIGSHTLFSATTTEELTALLQQFNQQLQTLDSFMSQAVTQPFVPTRAQLDSFIAEFQAHEVTEQKRARYKQYLEQLEPTLTEQEKLTYEFWYYAAPLYLVMHQMDTQQLASISIKKFMHDINRYRKFLNTWKENPAITIPQNYELLLDRAEEYLLAIYNIAKRKKLTYEAWTTRERPLPAPPQVPVEKEISLEEERPLPPLPQEKSAEAEETGLVPPQLPPRPKKITLPKTEEPMVVVPTSPLQKALQERRAKLRTSQEQKLSVSVESAAPFAQALEKSKVLQQAQAAQQEEETEPEEIWAPEEEAEETVIETPRPSRVAPPPPPPAPAFVIPTAPSIPAPPVPSTAVPSSEPQEKLQTTIAQAIQKRRASIDEEEEEEQEEDWD